MPMSVQLWRLFKHIVTIWPVRTYAGTTPCIELSFGRLFDGVGRLE